MRRVEVDADFEDGELRYAEVAAYWCHDEVYRDDISKLGGLVLIGWIEAVDTQVEWRVSGLGRVTSGGHG